MTQNAETPKQDQANLDYYSATQWQLIWWRFRRHRSGLVAAILLLLMVFVSLFAEFFAPYSGTVRNTGYLLGPPQIPRLISDGGILLHVPGVTTERDPNTLRAIPVIDETIQRSIQFFVQGEPYKLLGIIPTDIHLFGVDKGSIHLFGTDDLGRDLFSRAIIATRTSLSIGVIGVLIAFFLALGIGGIAGYYGGWVDYIIQRLTEVIRVIPVIPLYMGLAAAFPVEWSSEQVYFAMTLILGLVGWPTLARRIRSQLLSLRTEDYVVAAMVSGATPFRIITRHLLPAFTSYIIVDLVISFPYMILSETALSFIGLGLRPPAISWGILLQDAQNIRAIEQAPWLFIPAIFVVLAVLCFTILGDGVRDAADPYSEGGH